MTPEALNAKVTTDDKNPHAVLGHIQTAKLRRGLLNSRLSIALHDGTHIKLLWLRDDPAHKVLAELLQDRLGSNLKSR